MQQTNQLSLRVQKVNLEKRKYCFWDLYTEFLLLPLCCQTIDFFTHWPFPKQQILESSKLKEFADDSFKVGENGRKFSKWIENTVGKGEIACYEQFLLFPQCLPKACTPNT